MSVNQEAGRIRLMPGVEVLDRHNTRRGCKLFIKNPQAVSIGRRVSFDISDNIFLGERVIIGEDTLIETHRHDIEDPWDQSKLGFCQLVIEDDVWIGARSIILCGVGVIGQGARVYAGSVLTKPVAAFSKWRGVPATMLGMREGKGNGGG